MNEACIVKSHYAGLWSLVNNLLAWMETYPHVSVDWSSCLYGPDTFYTLFDPMPFADEDYLCDIVGVHPDQPFTYLNAGRLYQGPADWRQRCHKLWNRLKVRPEIIRAVDAYVERHFGSHRIVAALIRGHTNAGEQLTDRSQMLDEYADWISKELADGRSRAYIAASDSESLDWFRKRFDIICHPQTIRAPTRSIDRHLTEKQTEQDAVICLEEVLIMARADVLIHGISNMATASLYVNPGLKSLYLS